MPQKILITGGTGFIAKNLSEQLNGEFTVLSPGKKELNLLETSKVFAYIKNNKFDVVLHTATYDAAPKYSTKDLSKILEKNLKMFFNITRCKDYFGKMIYFGSGGEFSREHWIPKMKEGYFDAHVPQDQYGFSKYVMTKYALLNSNIYNLRLFGVFGKYDWSIRFTPDVYRNVIFNRIVRINQNTFFDFLYVDDLVKIVRWFINHKPKTNVYNVCTGQVIDFISIARKIIKISGKKMDIAIKKEGLGKEYSGDNTLLFDEVKNFEFTPIDVSLKYLYDWYVQNKNIFNKNHNEKNQS